MKKLKVLIGCEFSQIVTKAFRDKGHEAYSCDIIPAEGGHPEWHYNKYTKCPRCGSEDIDIDYNIEE
jgi:hypothetical protein